MRFVDKLRKTLHVREQYEKEQQTYSTKQAPPSVEKKYDFNYYLEMNIDGTLRYTFSMTPLLYQRLRVSKEFACLKNECMAMNYMFSLSELYADDKCVLPPTMKIQVPYSDSCRFENSNEFLSFLARMVAIKKLNDIVENPELQASMVNDHYKRIEGILDRLCDECNDKQQTETLIQDMSFRRGEKTRQR